MEHLDDEILQSFVDESREHLADIETDLLAIEEAGADIDEDIVNKVYRGRCCHARRRGCDVLTYFTVDFSHDPVERGA